MSEFRTFVLARAAILAALALFHAAVPAQEFTVRNLTIVEPWSRALPPNAPNGAAYFRVENSGGESDRIVSARTDIADTVEIHMHEMDGGMMKMRRVESVEVPAGGEARFKPHGLHLMLFGLKEPLAGGTSYALTVVFEKAGELDVSVDVKRVE
jgi:copper(I)-binding protein